MNEILPSFILMIIGAPFFLFGLGFLIVTRMQAAKLHPQPSAYWVITVFIIIGLAMFSAGMYWRHAIKQRESEISYLMQHGKRVTAHIEHVELKQSYKVNGRSPYIIYASYQDPTSKQSYTFASDNIWSDPLYELQGKTTVEVLVDPNNFSSYYVDTNFLPAY